MRLFLLFSLFILSASCLPGTPIDSLALDKIVQEHIDDHQFSGVVLVAQDGRPVYHRAAGVAELPGGTPITPEHHFGIASVTKLFTTVLILRLVDRGELRLQQSVAELLPELEIPRGNKITVHHLLLHQSGLPNEAGTVYGATSGPLTAEEIVSRTVKERQRGRFGQFNYNNIDYLLLGLIIEATTGRSWREVIRQEILSPFGLEQTGFLALGQYPEHFAKTFSCKGENSCTPDPTYYVENFHAAASMYSTTTDLLRFDWALYDHQLLSEKSMALLAQPYPENNYAGYSVWNYRYPFTESKPTIMERRGGIMGANVVLVRLTDSRHTIIILSNTDRFNPDSFGDPNNLREALVRAVAP
ncbi:serine hydrolase [Lewinella sp. W8]|uniref:serine hydrolase domain-containing protein n=1 Tax=Lewinella sp. W8 TaxID=2528208 RepID=UPI0010675C40|nr:serine hydrolase domain-containing protein [Lewinella sp. W8]MTB53211.1 serine hydrolase [Lewinella sp. W8]